MAAKDPTVKSGSRPDNNDALAGVHPAVPISEGADAADNKKYAENRDKPDPSTVAQVEVTE